MANYIVNVIFKTKQDAQKQAEKELHCLQNDIINTTGLRDYTHCQCGQTEIVQFCHKDFFKTLNEKLIVTYGICSSCGKEF